jgi:hypothetical protein
MLDAHVYSDDAVSGAETEKLVNRQRLLDATHAGRAPVRGPHSARRLVLLPARRRRGVRRIEAARTAGRRGLVLFGRDPVHVRQTRLLAFGLAEFPSQGVSAIWRRRCLTSPETPRHVNDAVRSQHILQKSVDDFSVDTVLDSISSTLIVIRR